MTDSNGRPELSVKDIIDQALSNVYDDDGSLLPELIDAFSDLRLAILGGRRNGTVWPAATLKISRMSSSIALVLEIPGLEIEARWTGKKLSGIAEQVQNDLALDCVRWQPNWRGKQRQERKMFA